MAVMQARPYIVSQARLKTECRVVLLYLRARNPELECAQRTVESLDKVRVSYTKRGVLSANLLISFPAQICRDSTLWCWIGPVLAEHHQSYFEIRCPRVRRWIPMNHSLDAGLVTENR